MSERVSSETGQETPVRIIAAARSCLLADGYATLSTRRVADQARVPLSQIHYYFGGKQGLVLALLDHENRSLVERQRRMYTSDTPLWQRYEQACDFLDDDLASGYVRVLQEMIAAGWSDDEVAQRILLLLQAWYEVLLEVAREAERRFGPTEPFGPADLAGLVCLAFLGGEAVMLLGDARWASQVRVWLRRLAELLRRLEEAPH